ncbi:hypothetical protein [Pseudofrankia sp. DC12]|uniref:hypothetical protein n=1 Tax=Pseudofrankia sp. DC12 TaxID=683315 RepID=UPI0005F7FF4F|nr:hypothetical protein [Pseudofrankia sp. DC12]
MSTLRDRPSLPGGGGWRSRLASWAAAAVLLVAVGLCAVMVWRLVRPVPDRVCPPGPAVVRSVPPPVLVLTVGGVS